MNIKKLREAIDVLNENLDGALLSTDIWPSGSGTAVAGYNQNPQATALFDKVSDYMRKALSGAGFPDIKDYYLLEMEGDAMVVVVQFKNEGYQWGMLVDTTKVNLGLLLNIAIPEARKSFLNAYNA